MNRLFQLFVNICLLRAKPQDLPSSVFLAAVLAVVNLITGTLVVVGSFGSVLGGFLAQLMDIVLVALAFNLALRSVGKGGRFYQAMAAMYGCGILINFLSVPLILMSPEASALEGGAATSGPWALLYLLLILWAITIGAHIVRHTFDLPFALGVVISLGYFLVINAMLQPFFTPGAA